LAMVISIRTCMSTLQASIPARRTVTPTPDFAGLVADRGCTLICATNDLKLVTAGLLKVKEQFSGLR
jgi:hypothetical protein